MNRKTQGYDRLVDFAITDVKIDSAWAFVNIEPAGDATDPSTLLLRKHCGGWRALVLGTTLCGTCRYYGVPRRLWKKWGFG